MPYAERGRVCVACVAIRAAANGLNGQCVAIHMLGGDGSLVSEILKEFGVATESFVFWTICRCNASTSISVLYAYYTVKVCNKTESTAPRIL